jgi:small neutral amino acid transporter SnatA (MarC family)
MPDCVGPGTETAVVDVVNLEDVLVDEVEVAMVVVVVVVVVALLVELVPQSQPVNGLTQ